jgi:hypothetical protein
MIRFFDQQFFVERLADRAAAINENPSLLRPMALSLPPLSSAGKALITQTDFDNRTAFSGLMSLKHNQNLATNY